MFTRHVIGWDYAEYLKCGTLKSEVSLAVDMTSQGQEEIQQKLTSQGVMLIS